MCSHRWLRAVRQLLEVDEFVEAAKEDDLARLRELLRHDIYVNKERALASAAENGQLEVVRYLVEQCSAPRL